MANSKKNQSEPTCGILSIVVGIIGWIFLGILFEPAGIILASYGLAKEENKLPSIIGLIISIVGLLMLLIFFVMASSAMTRW